MLSAVFKHQKLPLFTLKKRKFHLTKIKIRYFIG